MAKPQCRDRAEFLSVHLSRLDNVVQGPPTCRRPEGHGGCHWGEGWMWAYGVRAAPDLCVSKMGCRCWVGPSGVWTATNIDEHHCLNCAQVQGHRAKRVARYDRRFRRVHESLSGSKDAL